MKPLIHALLTGLAMIIQAGAASVPSPEDLRQSFILHYDEATAQRDEQLKKLDSGYLGMLERQRDTVKATGKLEAVIPIHAEIEMVQAHQAPLPRLPDTTAPELKQMRDKYVDRRDKILGTHAETVSGLFGKLEAALTTQETELTKAGRIDEAIASKMLRESLATTVDIEAVREFLKQGGGAGNTRPALRLRRYGDNIEVLVFRDHRGKISMESPVLNVREETGGKKQQLGDTKAKVLGEFVGAKGYTVDPYIAYHQVFDTKDPKNLNWGEILPTYRHEEDKQKGLRLSFKPNPVNPYCSFGSLLPPNSCKGSFRISARYFVPKSNRVISGFILVHSFGGAIGSHIFEERGKWVSGEITGESTNDSSTLLFYLTTVAGQKAADAANEYLVLGELKVVHTKFSAFLQKQFAPNGEISASFDDPLKQPLYISNGELPGK